MKLSGLPAKESSMEHEGTERSIEKFSGQLLQDPRHATRDDDA